MDDSKSSGGSENARTSPHRDGEAPQNGSALTAQPAPAETRDLALVVGRVGDDGLAIVRKRSPDAPLEAGIVQPLRDGQAIHGEVVKLTPRADAPLVCDVEVHHDGRTRNATAASRSDAAEPPALTRKGPAKVASPRFRDGWDRVFGGRREDDLPN